MLKWDTALPGWRGDRAGQGHGRSTEHFSSSTEGEGEAQRACYPYLPSDSRRWQLAISNECVQLTPHRAHSETYLLWVCFQWQQAPKRLSSKLWPAGNAQSPLPKSVFSGIPLQRRNLTPNSLALGVKLSRCSSDTFWPLPWLSVKSHLAFQPPHLLSS